MDHLFEYELFEERFKFKQFYELADKYSKKLSTEEKKILRSWVVNLATEKSAKKFGLYSRSYASKEIMKNAHIREVSQEFLRDFFKKDSVKIHRTEFEDIMIHPIKSYSLVKKSAQAFGWWKKLTTKEIDISNIYAVPALSFFGWDKRDGYSNEFEVIA